MLKKINTLKCRSQLTSTFFGLKQRHGKMKNLKNNLKQLLQHAKLSENELARRTGVSQQIINRILSGENQNPKIATLYPLANYFMVSISELLGEVLRPSSAQLNTNHLGWQSVPLIEWEELVKAPITDLILRSSKSLLIDIKPSDGIFAVKLKGDSMEPKFSEGTLLFFDLEKKPSNGDFVLLCLNNKESMVRQFFKKHDIAYKKCLNPNYPDYTLTLINDNTHYLGTLIQSRMDYSLPSKLAY